MTQGWQDGFARRGWHVFPPDPGLMPWVDAAMKATDRVLQDAAWRDRWLVCRGTWFVGVDALQNDDTGALDGVALSGAALRAVTPHPPLHRAQVSVVYPGYPQPREGDSTAAFRYRRDRDAAHVDGILAEGPDRRRFLRDAHAFVLGLPLNPVPPEASPLVVWTGSHVLLGNALRQAVEKAGPGADPASVDVTDAYSATRAQVFAACPRAALHAPPGSAILLHRHLLHGVAPWQTTQSVPEGRRVAYFRPLLPGGLVSWLAP